MEDKNYLEVIDNNVDKMSKSKNEVTFLIFGFIFSLLAGVGMYAIVSLGFSLLNPIVIKIIMAISMLLNIIFAFLRADIKE